MSARLSAEQPQDPAADQAPALVAVNGWIGPYPALVDSDCAQSGWVAPNFNLEAARRIAEDTQRLAAAGGRADVVRIVGDRAEVVYHAGPDLCVDIVAPDAWGLYRIGAPAWTWSVVDGAAPCLEECLCGAGCGCPDGCAVCGEPVDGGHAPRCRWTAGSAPHEQPVIPPQPAVLDAHRHRPGCPSARRRPGPLFITDSRSGSGRCGLCGAVDGLDAHTPRRSGGGFEHHQRCAACGQTWSAAGPTAAA